MSTDTLIRAALDAGVALKFEDGKLKMCGRADVVRAWAPRLREQKASLIAELQKKEHSIDDWRELDRAYQSHHWNCVTCQASGRGKNYGLRCGAGAALWAIYTAAATGEKND